MTERDPGNEQDVPPVEKDPLSASEKADDSGGSYNPSAAPEEADGVNRDAEEGSEVTPVHGGDENIPEPSAEKEKVDSTEVDTSESLSAEDHDLTTASSSEATVAPETADESKTDAPVKRPWLPWAVYAGVPVLVLILLLTTALFSTAARVDYNPAPDQTRDGLGWGSPPAELLPIWTAEGYNGLINTPGAMVATTENALHGLDSATGETLWSYSRPGRICDAITTSGNVTAVYENGHGCSEVITLDSATGKYLYQARYATDSDEARMVEGIDGHIALVTREQVRVLSHNLVPEASFGERPDPLYPNDQDVSDCFIYDVAMGPKHVAIAAQCAGDTTTHLRTIKIDPDEATKGETVMDIDTGAQGAVTLPAISISMVIFVVPGVAPAAYVWQLDKDHAEVASHPIGPNEYGMGYQDIDGIGYVWRIGSTVHARWGSEDLSKSDSRDGAIGKPMAAGTNLLVPRVGSVLAWEPEKASDPGTESEITVNGLNGRDFAFSGATLAAYNPDTGVITGYA